MRSIHSQIKDTVPAIEACLYSHINWYLEQAHQLSSLGFSQSSTSMRSYQGQAKGWFQVYCMKEPVPESGGATLPKKLHLDSRTEGCHIDRKSAGVHLPV